MLNFSLDYPEQKMYLGYGFGASLLWIFWPIFMEWMGSSTIIENGDFWVLFLLIIAFWGGILQSKIVAMFSEQSTILVTKNRLGWISIISLVILFAWSTITSFRGIMSETTHCRWTSRNFWYRIYMDWINDWTLLVFAIRKSSHKTMASKIIPFGIFCCK